MIKFNLQKGFTHTPTLKKAKLVCGFTLLEALVAISILMVAVAAPITIAQKGLSSAVYSKNQLIASYLAQDVIEYIKNKRDEVSIENVGSSLGWDSLNIFTNCLGDDWCRIDTINTPAIDPDQSSVLRVNSDGFYNYGSGDPTDFVRKVNIKINASNTDEALITVIVNWGGSDNNVTVRTRIYNI